MKNHLKTLGLPLFVAAYPILFLYGRNAWLLSLRNLVLPLGAALLVAGCAYGLFLVFQRNPVKASLSAVALVALYYLYGTIYRLLVKQDQFVVQHFTLLPLVLVTAGYAGYALTHIPPRLSMGLQKGLLLIASVLVLINVGIILPAEFQKVQDKQTSLMPSVSAASVPVTGDSKKSPDIYYIILDEYAGFDAIREYWHEDYVDEFENYLKQNGFFVATGSRSPTINTGTELASRLNMHLFPENTATKTKMDLINNNKVMQVMKANGYTTVALSMYFQSIKADYPFQFTTDEVHGAAADEFQQDFLDDTMFNAFAAYIKDDVKVAAAQRSLVFYTLDKTVNLAEIQSPKFVFTHVLMPHQPFIFDEKGNFLPPQANDDWHYYLGQHKYATKLAEQLLTRLLANADPQNPPVIIIQSDHGARNLLHKTKDNIILNGVLENYPDKYKHMILNALYLPGYDASLLSKDMEPIDAIELVIDHYLDSNVALGTQENQ